MFFLPRICEHCLNPSCMASCPSGAIYKRAEDGIVLVDQDRCRGWRQCITGCPYKKIYFNHRSGKAEKCTFCYPRIEVGPADRLLGDLRRPAALPRHHPLRPGRGHRGRLRRREGPVRGPARPDARPARPEVVALAARRRHARTTGSTRRRRSPIYALTKHFQVALPLHPEYRTMPMVWYIPPLSPVVDLLRTQGHDAEAGRQPVRRDRRAADPGGATSPSCSPPATATSSPGAAEAGRDARRTCAASPSAPDGTRRWPRPSA